MNNDIIVGIDLGTTNSAVAIVENGVPRLLPKGDKKIIPSVVGYSEQSGWLVGQAALNQYTLDPDNTVRSIKRKMGTDELIEIGGRKLSPQKISSLILTELKNIAEKNLGQEVSKAVITVPAYFTDSQRQATKEAGEIAGLEVVRIINEPTAAAMAYGLNTEDDQMALVYDLGGGTFDVSLVEMVDGVIEVRASHGDTQLGGDDFDNLLAEHTHKLFYKKHQVSLKNNRISVARVITASEAAKIKLSDFPEARLREEYLIEKDGVPLHLDAKLNRFEFEELIQDLLQRTTKSIDKVLEDAELNINDLNRVLLVGGSTRIPAVWDIVRGYTKIEPDAEIDPDEAVALGAAIQAAIIAGQQVDAILVDVTPYSLGIKTAMHVGMAIIPDVFSVLIRRNTTIPVTKEEIFYTVHKDQEEVNIKVYQGELPIASANTLLGEFLLENVKPTSPGEHPNVNVRFSFDVNGILTVQAVNQGGDNNQKTIKVEAIQARLTPQEIAKAREELSDMQATDGDDVVEKLVKPVIDDETKALLERAKTLIDGGTLTAENMELLTNLTQAIDGVGSQAELDDLAEDLLDILFELE